MKICHILFNSYGKFAGPFEYTQSLSKLNNSVSVICCGVEKDFSPQTYRAVRIYSSKSIPDKFKSLMSNIQFLINCKKFLKNQKFDVIHIYHFRLSFFLLILPSVRRTKIFLDVRSKNVSGTKTAWFNNGLTWFESLFFKNKITLTSNLGKAIFKGQKFSVLPLGANLNIFKINNQMSLRTKLGFNQNNIVFITHGTLGKNRKQNKLLDAFRESVTLYPDFRLLIVGDGDGYKIIESYIERFKLKDSVILTGKVPYLKISDYINAADIGVAYIPQENHFENQPPLKIAEYLACGKPVIATNTNGNRLFIDHRNGILINEADFYRGLNVMAKEFQSYDPFKIRQSIMKFNYDSIVEHTLSKYYSGS